MNSAFQLSDVTNVSSIIELTLTQRMCICNMQLLATLRLTFRVAIRFFFSLKSTRLAAFDLLDILGLFSCGVRSGDSNNIYSHGHLLWDCWGAGP